MKLYYALFNVLRESFRGKPTDREDGLLSSREEWRMQLLSVKEGELTLFVRDPSLPLVAFGFPYRDLRCFYREPFREENVSFEEYAKEAIIIEDTSQLSEKEKKKLSVPKSANYVRNSLIPPDIALIENRLAPDGLGSYRFFEAGDIFVFEYESGVELEKAISDGSIEVIIDAERLRSLPKSVSDFRKLERIQMAQLVFSEEAKKRLLPLLFESFSERRKKRKKRVL